LETPLTASERCTDIEAQRRATSTPRSRQGLSMQPYTARLRAECRKRRCRYEGHGRWRHPSRTTVAVLGDRQAGSWREKDRFDGATEPAQRPERGNRRSRTARMDWTYGPLCSYPSQTCLTEGVDLLKTVFCTALAMRLDSQGKQRCIADAAVAASASVPQSR
jgi:hypothetical protein